MQRRSARPNVARTLTLDASRTYLQLSIAAHGLGQLSRYQLICRLLALRKLCERGDPSVHQISGFVSEADIELEEEWPEGEDEVAPLGPTRSTAEAKKSTGSNDDDVMLHFIPGPTTGMSDWTFHPYDADYFPSIPHGHYKGRPHPKLDPYLAWVYHGSKQIRRVPRYQTIALWNDTAFRAMARQAIQFYLTFAPHYAGWRVFNPTRLPRKRP